MQKSIALAVAAGIASLFLSTAAHAVTGNWIGPTSSSWSDSAAWQDGIIPNAQGDTAQYLGGAGSQISLVNAGNIRVGVLRAAMTTNISWQIRPVNDVIMDQDGAGPLRASILNEIQSTNGANNPAIFVNSNTGWLTLNDDLFISNTSNSVRTSGAVQMQTKIQGNGNIWIENISNNIGAGQVAFTGQGAYGGHTTIAKGAVTFTRGDVFAPSPPNVVTIGSTGGGDATLAFVGGNLGNMENNFVAAANTGGTNVFGTSAAATGLVNIKSSSSQTLPHSLVTLNGDLSFSSGGTGLFQIGDPIVGVGKLTKIGPGEMRVTNTNTYAGGTVVDAGILSVAHADAINNGFGFYDATDGTLGSGNVTVNSGATKLAIDAALAAVNVIANTATLSLAGGGTPDFADQGFADLGAGINDTVGGLILGGLAQTTPGTYGSVASGAMFPFDEYFSGTGLITLSPVDADFDNDGDKDGNDFLIWQRGLGTGTTNAQGDANGDAVVDGADLALWIGAFGTAVPAATAIPEPAAAWLLLLAAPALMRARRAPLLVCPAVQPPVRGVKS